MAVLLLCATSSAQADDAKKKSSLDRHLEREAARLAANPDKNEQEDAAWVARQLGDDRSAKRMKELLMQRLAAIYSEYAARLKKDHPQLYDYPTHRAKALKGTNGAKELDTVVELGETIRKDKRFTRIMEISDVDFAELPAAIRTAFMKETEPLLKAMQRAAAADEIVFMPPRPKKLEDIALDFRLLNMTRALVARAHIHAVGGDFESCNKEFKIALQVLSRSWFESNLLGTLTKVVTNDIALHNGALLLATYDGISAAQMREWLELGKLVRIDVMLSLGVEFADGMRIVGEGGDKTDRIDELEDGGQPVPVEDAFKKWRKMLDGCMSLVEYAGKKRAEIHTLPGIREAAQFEGNVAWSISLSIRDAGIATWSWAALELRILQRERGPLHVNPDLVEKTLAAWPALRAEWREKTLLLWIKDEYSPGEKPTSCFLTLPPLKE